MTYEAWRISFQSSEQAARAAYEAAQSNALNAQRWLAMRQTLVAADFAPEMGGGPVVMFACHAERVGFGPDGADAIADAAVTAMNGANARHKPRREVALG